MCGGSSGKKPRPALASSADSHLPSACICIHFNAHIEREHVFNGDHGKMNYTDSVRDLMIYVHNTLKQMTGAGTAAEDGTGGAEPQWGREPPACFPLLSLGPLGEAALKTDSGL